MGTSIAGCDFLCYATVLVPLTRDLRSRIHFLYSVYLTVELRCAQPSFKSVIPFLSHSDWSHCRGKAMETSPSGNWENITWPEDQMAMLPYTSMPLTQKRFYNTQHWLWHFPKETFSPPPKSCEMLGGSRVKVQQTPCAAERRLAQTQPRVIKKHLMRMYSHLETAEGFWIVKRRI